MSYILLSVEIIMCHVWSMPHVLCMFRARASKLWWPAVDSFLARFQELALDQRKRDQEQRKRDTMFINRFDIAFGIPKGTQTRAERGAEMMKGLLTLEEIPTSYSNSHPVVEKSCADKLQAQRNEFIFNGLLQPILEGLVAGLFRPFFLSSRLRTQYSIVLNCCAST